MDLPPLQSPEALQDVGLFVVVQVSVEEFPAVKDVGLAVKVTFGAPGGGGGGDAGAFTVSTEESDPVPPALEQVSVYV